MLTDHITFIVNSNDRQVLAQNVLTSPALCVPHNHEILVQEDFASAGRAYNYGLDRASNDLLIFIHSDMFLPEAWIQQLEAALQYLERADPNWGVLGCWGARRSGEYLGHIYSTGWGILGNAFEKPEPVQTLDEIILIFRKSSGLRFDESLPHFHFYGTDICMRAAKRGMTSYAMSAFCIHNTAQTLLLPDEFYRCYWHVRRTWSDELPIQTSCIRVSKYNLEMYRRRVTEGLQRILGMEAPGERRVSDPSVIRLQIEAQ